MAEREREVAHTRVSSSLYKGTNPIMRVSPSEPHLNSIASQQFYLQISIRFEARASMDDIGRDKNIHSITVCVCVTDERELHGAGMWRIVYTRKNCIYQVYTRSIYLYFNVRLCWNFWAICLSERFWKCHGNSAILRLLLGKFSSSWSLCHRLSGSLLQIIWFNQPTRWRA